VIPQTIGDLLAAGQSALRSDLADHIAAGAGDESTVAANRSALDRWRLVPGVAVGVGQVSTATEVFGVDLTVPIVTAPMGPMELIDPRGARAVADGVADAGGAVGVALTSAPVLEEVATVDAPMLFQLYWWGDRDWLASMVQRIEAAGYIGIIVTVDVPDYGTRWCDVRNRFDHHGQMRLPNLIDAPPDRATRLAHQASLTWDDLAWFCSITVLPVAVKGILSGTDARRAIGAGADAVYVSNHGGRALAGQLGACDAMDEVTAAVAGAVPIIVDGGFRTAEDVAKGLALGASVIGLGRPIAWALACGGANGVARYLTLLADDLRVALTVLGARSPAELGPGHLRKP